MVATGSPFAPVELNGKTFIPSQVGNVAVVAGEHALTTYNLQPTTYNLQPCGLQLSSFESTPTPHPPPAPAPPPPSHPQCNNMYVFPGIGLAASVAGVTEITDKMLYLASVACADAINADEVAEGRTFPAVGRIRQVSHQVACKIIDEALRVGKTTKIPPNMSPEEVSEYVAAKMVRYSSSARRARRHIVHIITSCPIIHITYTIRFRDGTPSLLPPLLPPPPQHTTPHHNVLYESKSNHHIPSNTTSISRSTCRWSTPPRDARDSMIP